MEFGIFHNGVTNLPFKEAENGLLIPDASFEEMNKDRQQVTKDQIRHAVLAEKHGFDRVSFTEHHFVITGAEYSPNPLLAQIAVAAQTDRIKLRQMANIIQWHDPVRLAEQTAMLDVVSDGRLEVGIGRGYQPREAELFGQYWGGGVQDQEQNRASFKEKLEILIAAWTEDLVSYSGEFHQVPPSYTKHHHPQEHAYLADDVSEYDVEDMLEWKPESVAETELPEFRPNAVSAGESTLKSVAVYPKPVQNPYPQLWQPLNSPRSIKFAAERGINPYLPGARDPARVRRFADDYYEAVEAAGWPDRRAEFDGEPFDRVWDEERERGLTIYVPVFNTEVGSAETFERWKKGIIAYWQYIGWFGAAGGLPNPDGVHPISLLRSLEPELFLDRDLYVAGDAEKIIDRLETIIDELDAVGISFDVSFENVGITGEEADEQLRAFGEEVIPYFKDT